MTAQGPRATLICLHSSASSGRQWSHLAELLGPRYQVISPDLQGYGRNPPWLAGRDTSLEEEVVRLAPIIATLDAPAHIVGHSYGAAVAVRMALDHPERVASLSLYEPTLFSVLLQGEDRPSGAEEVEAVAGELARLLEQGAHLEAAEMFVTYWAGDTAWGALRDDQRERLAQRAHKAPVDFSALFEAGIDRTRLREIGVPVLCIRGGRTRLPAKRVAECFDATLPNIRSIEIAQLGHMGPLTHPELIDPLVGEFLEALESRTTIRHPVRITRARHLKTVGREYRPAARIA